MSSYIVDNMLYKGEEVDSDQREIMMFGITRILEDTPKYVLIFLMSLFFGILKEVGVVLLVTLVYKTFLGGAHARTNIICFIFSSIFFITPAFISKYIEINNAVFYISLVLINIFSLYVIIRYAPSDTEEVPILNKDKRKTMKILAIISQVIIDISLVLFIKNSNIGEIILISNLYSNIMATSVAYKVFKCKRSKDSEEFSKYFEK